MKIHFMLLLSQENPSNRVGYIVHASNAGHWLLTCWFFRQRLCELEVSSVFSFSVASHLIQFLDY